MADIVGREQRSRMMAGIKGKNTRPERFVRSFLHRNGFRFRLHAKGLPGRPDIILPRYRAVVMVHGCFWHRHPGCRFAYTPKSNTEFWLGKFAENTARDRKVVEALRQSGWRVFTVWECQAADERVLETLVAELRDRHEH